jgi:hypothetical protein
MHIDTLTIRSDTAPGDEKLISAAALRRARWLGAALAVFAMSAVLFASGLAVVMSLS